MSDRRYPKFPIPGVGAIVVSHKGILLVRRNKEPGKGMWSIPGGGVEIGETLKEAIIREVLEETGVDIEPLYEIGYVDLITKDNQGSIEFHYLILHFLAKASSIKLKPESPNADVNWFAMRDIPLTETLPQIIELLVKHEDQILAIQEEL